MFHSQKFDCTIVSSVSKNFQQEGCKDSSQKFDCGGVDRQVTSDIESFGPSIGFFQLQNDIGLPMSQQQHFEELAYVDDLYLDVVSPCSQSSEDEIKKMVGTEAENTELNQPKKTEPYVFPSESFKVLAKYQRRRLKLDGKLSSACDGMQSTHAHIGGPMLQTETTIKLAAEKFIWSRDQIGSELSELYHPCQCSVLVHSEEDYKEVQLVHNLLYCAEKVAENQYERAMKFLKECDKTSSRSGTPIQRLVFYFSEALFEKIAVETGRIIRKDVEMQLVDPEQLVMFPNMPLHIAFNKEYPLSQITKLVGIQAVLDHLDEARKVHMIDLEIRSGVHWIILMQALAARSEHPIEQLKITAVGTICKLIMEETGRQLTNFARSLDLKFTFKIVFVEDILDLNHNLFDLDADESVAVYAPYILTSMVERVDRLSHLMKVMRNTRPCVMIVTELEANCNSPTFIGRFVESLFFFGAFFDSLADCFKNDEESRANAESIWFRLSIRNVLATEGEQRKIRLVDINVWRAFFAHLGLVEIELSISSLDQARLGLQSLPCGSSCTLYRDEKCLTVGWKGTPLSSLSAWKFR